MRRPMDPVFGFCDAVARLDKALPGSTAASAGRGLSPAIDAPAGVFAAAMRRRDVPLYGLGPEDWRRVAPALEDELDEFARHADDDRLFHNGPACDLTDHLHDWLLKCRNIEQAAGRDGLALRIEAAAFGIAAGDPAWIDIRDILSDLFEETYP